MGEALRASDQLTVIGYQRRTCQVWTYDITAWPLFRLNGPLTFSQKFPSQICFCDPLLFPFP
jgi:hypothetical protein